MRGWREKTERCKVKQLHRNQKPFDIYEDNKIVGTPQKRLIWRMSCSTSCEDTVVWGQLKVREHHILTPLLGKLKGQTRADRTHYVLESKETTSSLKSGHHNASYLLFQSLKPHEKAFWLFFIMLPILRLKATEKHMSWCKNLATLADLPCQ